MLVQGMSARLRSNTTVTRSTAITVVTLGVVCLVIYSFVFTGTYSKGELFHERTKKRGLLAGVTYLVNTEPFFPLSRSFVFITIIT